MIIVLLITVSLTIAIVFLVAFLWSLHSGQYEDTYTPSVRILFDDETKTDDGTTVEEEEKSNPS